MPERKNFRKYYKELRNAMAQETVVEKSKRICEKVLTSKEYRQAELILGYYPLGNEVDCLPVLGQALSDGKRVSLPRTAKDCQMDFYEIESLEDVSEGAFHVMEPNVECMKVVLPQKEDIFQEIVAENAVTEDTTILGLVPGVVFDHECNRFGYGKGYYDRYFARCRDFTRMALAYAEQISDEPLACMDTDVKMHQVVTDNEIIGKS